MRSHSQVGSTLSPAACGDLEGHLCTTAKVRGVLEREAVEGGVGKLVSRTASLLPQHPPAPLRGSDARAPAADGPTLVGQSLECFADAPVQSNAASLGQGSIEDRLHQRVRKPILVETGLVHEPRVERNVEEIERVVFVGATDETEKGDVEMTPDHGRGREQILDLGREASQPLRDHISHGRRYGAADVRVLVKRRKRTQLGEITDQFVYKKRVAVGFRMNQSCQLFGRRVSRHAGLVHEEFVYRALVEPREPASIDAADE